MSNPKLTNQDYCQAAKQLNCEPAALMAVAQVESAGDGYDSQGRIKLRFEGHKFREYTFGKYDQSHPDISYPYKIQKSKRHGYAEFSEAFALDEVAALKASSPGKFQPLGVNYREAGFTSVRDFYDYLRISEANQLDVFCRMVKFRHIDDELRRLDWAGFAENYNGASFRDNDYDGKMERAYKSFRRLKINCDELIAEPTVGGKTPAISSEMSGTDSADEHHEEADATDGAASAAPKQQVAENIINTGDKTVPDNFKPENKTVTAPPPSGMMTKATAWLAGLGIGLPSLSGLVEVIKNKFADGSFNVHDAFAVAGDVAKFVLPYAIYIGIAFIVFWGFKELLKQVSLIVKIWVTGKADMHNVEVKPYEQGQWIAAPVDSLPEAKSFLQSSRSQRPPPPPCIRRPPSREVSR